MSLCSMKGFLLPLLLFLVICSAFGICDARNGKHWRERMHHKPKPKPKPNPKPSPSPKPTPSPSSGTFNVLDYGAKGNGVTDDTEAFLAAWANACKVEASTMVVPSEYNFLVGPISFMGPCKPNIIFQLNGIILAPTSPKPWGSGFLQWLEFKKLGTGISIQGNGIIEGQGSAWWNRTQHYNSYTQEVQSVNSGSMPHTRPTALRVYGSYNVTVTGITIQNSPQCHLKFDSCEAVSVDNIDISSPGDSPHTDGIHLENSIDVSIHDSNIACGDDCISIQTGCSNVHVHDVNCGPGHGISIGGLGKGATKACVSNVTVQRVNMNNTMTGVRIKTWQGGSGYVQNIRFSDIIVSEVQTPIDIDQFYCDGGHCKNHSSAVSLSQISYENIKGTYTYQPVYLACSDHVPCTDITLTNIVLQPLQERSHIYDPFCWEAYGELYAPTEPPIDCQIHVVALCLSLWHSIEQLSCMAYTWTITLLKSSSSHQIRTPLFFYSFN